MGTQIPPEGLFLSSPFPRCTLRFFSRGFRTVLEPATCRKATTGGTGRLQRGQITGDPRQFLCRNLCLPGTNSVLHTLYRVENVLDILSCVRKYLLQGVKHIAG